jgi:hypothetical protein
LSIAAPDSSRSADPPLTRSHRRCACDRVCVHGYPPAEARPPQAPRFTLRPTADQETVLMAEADLQRALARSRSHPGTNVEAAYRRLLPRRADRRQYQPFFCLDELQHLFEDVANRIPRHPDNPVPVVKQVLEVSRYASTYTVVTGSSRKMSQYMFPEHALAAARWEPDGLNSRTPTGPDPWRAAGFPNFNRSVFVTLVIAPIR